MLYESQQRIVEQLIAALPIRGGAVAQMDAGLGKTRVALTVARRLNMPTIFLTPTGLFDEWHAEREKLGIETPFQVLAKYDKPGLSDWVLASYNCLNYEQFTKDVAQRRFLLVVDELANFKNETAQRTKALKALRESGDHIGLGLTATMVENDLTELFTQLSCVAPRFMSRKKFINRHVVTNAWTGVAGYRNLRTFRKRAKRYIFRLRREEVRHELPTKTIGKDYIYFVNPEPAALAAHKKFAARLLKSLAGIRDSMAAAELAGNEVDRDYHEYRAVVAKITSRRYITRVQHQLCDISGLGRAKLEFIYRLFARWSKPGAQFSGFPCLIFCDNVEQAEALKLHISAKMQERVELITGATPYKVRRAYRDAFNSGELRVLVCSAAGSRGSNLPNGRSLIHFSIPWNDAVIKQRNRIQRTSSAVKEQRYIMLVLKGTLDEHLLSIVRDKQHQAVVFDVGTSDSVKSRSRTWTQFLQDMLQKEENRDVEKAAKNNDNHNRDKGRARGCRCEARRYWKRRH